MKSRTSFILKASTALVLALVMLFGAVATSVAATVQNLPAVEDESAPAVTPFRDADGATKIVIYYDDTYSKLTELDGFEDLYFVIIGDTYYRGYKMADLQEDNKYVAFVNESYDDAKMFFVMAVDQAWTGETSEAVGAPFEKNVKKLPGVIGCTDTYSDAFVFETTNASMGHGYLLNTTEDAALTIEVNDIGVCPQEVVVPSADAEDEPAAPAQDEDAAPAEVEKAAPAEVAAPAVEAAPAEDAAPAEEAAPADDAADEPIVKRDKDADVAGVGAEVDLAQTGAQYNHNWGGTVYFRVPDAWNLSTYSNVRCVIRRSATSTTSAFNTPVAMSVVGATSYSRLYKCTLSLDHSKWGQNEWIAFFCCSSGYTEEGTYALTNTGIGAYTAGLDYGTNSGGYYLFYPNTAASATTTTTNNPISGEYNATEANVMKYNTGSHSAYAYTNGSSSSTGGTTSISSYYLSGTTPTNSTNTDTPTATYSSAMTGAKTVFTATAKTGYEFKGWYSNSALTSLVTSNTTYTRYTFSNATASNANLVYYAKFVTKPSVTVSATPAAGGTIKIAGTTVASGSSAYVSASTNTAVTVTAATGYTISSVSGAGWTRTAGETSTTSYTGTINTASNATLTVAFTETTGIVKLQSNYNGTDGTTGGTIKKTNSSGSNVTQTEAVGTSTSFIAYANAASGYTFRGWKLTGANASHIKYSTNSGSSWTTGSNGKYIGTTNPIYIKTDGTSGITASNAVFTAYFQKVHYISIYNTTMYDRRHWVVLGSPPQTVTVTGPSGISVTYTYAAGTKAQRGEDQTTSDSPGTNNNKTSGTYYEGNKLRIFAGDTVEMTYSALASSDIISGVFYNNSIRYTTELEDDNLFCLRTYREGGYGDRDKDDGEGASYHYLVGGAEVPDDDVDYFYDANYSGTNGIYDGHALYANANYYADATKTTITNNASNYAATVNEDTHKVTWTAGDRDYLNIDIELSSKKQVHFSDTANTEINSIHTDNYYTIGEDVSPGTAADTSLSVKAAGNTDQTNTITKANIKFYYCNNMGEYINPATGKKVSKENRVELTGTDATLSVGGSAASISNSGGTASSNFYYIDGAMPATDVMVDLDLTTTYNIYLRSKVMSDTIGSKTGFGQVANLQIGDSSYTANNNYTSTYTSFATKTCNAGGAITLKVSSITSGYMFVGWFAGTTSAPDLDSEPLSTSETFSFKPTAKTYVWAVGTRNLYIAGNKELFKDNANWTFHEMKFDATLGNQGKYYWEIDETIFGGANRAYTCVDNGTDYSKTDGYFSGGGTDRYWNTNNDDSKHGNAFFQFYDATSSAASESQTANKTVWNNVNSFEVEDSNIRYGKVIWRDADSDGNRSKKGEGFIAFSESTYPGWSTPIRIYYDPANTGTFTVEPTGIYPHIHVSNGTKGLDVASDGTPSEVMVKVNSGTARGNNTTSTTYTDMEFLGSGWAPTNEGHVSDIKVKARNATLTLTKTTSSSDYKVSNFIVYNMTKGTVKAHPATATGTANQYSCNTIKTSDDDRLYIVPVLEYIGSGDKMTVIVDSTQLDYDEWGKLVGCYIWGGTSKNGAYPGQLMVPADDGLSWKATFKADGMTGVTLTNYVDSYGGTGYTFIAMSGVMGTVTENMASGNGTAANPRKETATGGYVTVYNKIEGTDKGKGNYDKTNFKAQTYDYREPVAYYNNKPVGASSTVLTFALKEGNGELITWKHSDLTSENILDHYNKSSYPVDFEYLTDSSGKQYADLNGFILPEKPTASFYICAKAMVIYSDNAMTKVFYTGNQSDTTSSINYNDYKGKVTGEIDMDYAVQWYVYDASGKYITNVLTAGFADKNATHTDMSVVTQRLLDLGYAVEGRSVKICYDVPRYCYTDDNGPNTGTSFGAYRFTGQWYEDSVYKTANVYAKVGIMTDNGEEVAEASSAPYGSASVSVNNALCTVAGYSGTDTTDEGVDYGYTTVIDGDKGAITLTASETNFIGWYHYNSDKELKLDTTEATFRPSYSTDSTYIAMYEAKVNYSYRYEGREFNAVKQNYKYYSVGSDTHLNETEIGNGNKVAVDSTHTTEAGNKSPGSAGIGVFKKTVSFTTPVTTSMLSNPNEYELRVANSSNTNITYQITAKYRNANGDLATYTTPSTAYNTPVDLSSLDQNHWTGHRFIGWYEYKDAAHVGQLISTQVNYGMNMVKQQTIVAVYEGDEFGQTALPADGNWYAYVDDNEVNYEMTSAKAGTIYNDAIVRVRTNASNTLVLNENGKVGMIIVEDGGTNQTINTSKLEAYARALSTSGKTGNVSVTGGTAQVTNHFVSASVVNNFGRADFAAKYTFGGSSGHKYQIYPYYYDGSTYYFNTTATTGTYRSAE